MHPLQLLIFRNNHLLL